MHKGLCDMLCIKCFIHFIQFVPHVKTRLQSDPMQEQRHSYSCFLLIISELIGLQVFCLFVLFLNVV